VGLLNRVEIPPCYNTQFKSTQILFHLAYRLLCRMPFSYVSGAAETNAFFLSSVDLEALNKSLVVVDI